MVRTGWRPLALTTLWSVALILPLFFGALFVTNNLGGPSPLSFHDGNPSDVELARWQVQNFDPTGWRTWNANPNFAGLTYETGLISDTAVAGCLGEPYADWGFQLYGWGESRDDNIISMARCAARDSVVSVRARQDLGSQYGNGALIQGWNWWNRDSTSPMWRCPRPLAIAGKRLVVSVEMTVDNVEVLGHFFDFDRWLMVALTFWFQSPELTKSFVIDLAIRPRMNMMFSRESEDAYHYQRVVVRDITEAEGGWRHYDFDLSWFIDDALTRYGIERAKRSLTLTSMEALIETRTGDASFRIRHLALYYRSERR
jgi:hypothetical protein